MPSSKNMTDEKNKLPLTDRRSGKYSAIIIAVSILLILTILTVAIVSSLAPNEIHPKDEIRASMDDEPFDKNTVASYLRKWGLPNFDRTILDAVEQVFELYYYKDIAEEREIARDTTNVFLDHYYDNIDLNDSRAVALALVDSMIFAIGDGYAYYRTADETQSYRDDMSGSFAGIGINIKRNDKENTILISSVIEVSPANDAGLLAGDYVVAVDGARVTEIGASSAVNMIKGEVGTTVKVTVLRDGVEIDYDIVRQRVEEETVKYSILENGTVGYVKITAFKSNTDDKFVEAIDALELAGVEAVIFDLRSNPGGYLDVCAAMLSYLVPTGTPISSFSSLKTKPTSGTEKQGLFATDGEDSEFEQDGDHVFSIPCVVLCNSSSASGAELFTAALQDYNEMELLTATVMGDVTYKKGVMQATKIFTDDSTLTLTTHLYNAPSGRNYNGIGVIPDIPLDSSSDYLIEALEYLGKITSK